MTTAAATASPTTPRSRVVVAAALDVAGLLVFVVAGRRSHDLGDNAVLGTLEVAAPFLLALGVGWAVARAWRSPMRLATGAAVWAITVVLGMLLRRGVFDRGIAASFVVVATLVTGVLLLGWRAVAHLALARRR